MKIFIAGATGVIGRPLLPRLIREGHEVTALTRSSAGAEQLRAAGATPAVGDIFDRDKVTELIKAAKPEAVVHQLTSLPPRINSRKVKQVLAPTNRLRTEGTEILMEAAKSAGARRFVAQSISSYYAPTRATPAREDEPLYTDAPAAFVDVIQALTDMERTVLNTPGIEGIVLRYGYFYGPGTVYAADGTFAEDVSRRKVPIVGNGGGIFSFVHVEDAAVATALALNKAKAGVYNIVDDEPAPLREWLPVYAEMLDAPRPFRVPKFVGRIAAGRFGVYYMTEQRGASNKKAKQQLNWQPGYASWRDGFRVELAGGRQHDKKTLDRSTNYQGA